MTNEQLFEDLKQYIDGRMSQQSAQIEGVEQRLNARIDGVEQRLNIRIDTVEQRLHTRIGAVEQRLTTRIDGLDRKLDKVQDAIAGTVTHVAEEAEVAADTAVQKHEQRYDHGQLKPRAA